MDKMNALALAALDAAGLTRAYARPMAGQYRVQPDLEIEVLNGHGFFFSLAWLQASSPSESSCFAVRGGGGGYGDDEFVSAEDLDEVLASWLDTEPTEE